MNSLEQWLFKQCGEKLTPLFVLLLCRSAWLGVIWLFFLADLAPISISILVVTTFLHLLSIKQFGGLKTPLSRVMVGQISLDLIAMTLLLVFNGGATNAFVTALLLPVVFACISLKFWFCVSFTLIAMAAYSMLMWNMSNDIGHDTHMAHHYMAMWVNFILSVSIISVVVGSMARMVAKREKRISQQRERQLREEQVLAISIASAQVTHDIATPLATVQLLYEELKDQYPEDPLIRTGESALRDCATQLNQFRRQIDVIRNGTPNWLSVKEVLDTFSDAALLYFPQQKLQLPANVPTGKIWSDDMLLPALVNLLQNAVAANQEASQNQLELYCYERENQCIIELKDFGFGLSQKQLQDLGYEPVKSHRGLGISVFLSNVTLSRLGGTLELENHHAGGCLARVYLNYKRMTDEAVNH